jgi:Protein of unknown function (DUF1838)
MSPILTRRETLLAAGAMSAAMASPVAAAAPFLVEGGFDASSFKAWASARVGDGQPIWWYSSGSVRAYPSGQLLFFMEGFDSATSFRPDPKANLVHQYNRKIYVFRDIKTGEILRQWNGKAVEPVAYPYQFITYELKGDKVETWVEQGTKPRVQRIGPGTDMTARKVGDTYVFTAPVYLDFPIPGGDKRYQAFENYDFFVNTDGRAKEPHQLSWLRHGPLGAWADGADSIMHLVTWRVERWEDIAADLRGYIEREQPLWRNPPKDLAEIRRLQEGKA